MKSIAFIVTSVLASSVVARDAPTRVNIGYFRFPLQDPDIQKRVSDVESNITSWENFFDATLEYWNSNMQPQPVDDEEAAVRHFANNTGIESKDFESLMQQAKDTYQKDLLRFNNDTEQLWNATWVSGVPEDLSEKVLDAVEQEFKFLDHARLASYAGVGSPVDCSAHIDNILVDMSEWEKAGMSAASTLMALLPTFLAFGNLFVPRSSEAFATSWLIGLGAALFSLGLPVRSLSCIRRKQVLELATLDKDPLDEIGDLGARDEVALSATSSTNHSPRHDLDDLQQWTRPNPPQKYMREFARIRKAVDAYRDRWHWWHVPAIFIAAAQGCIFGFAIEPLLKAAGIPKFIFACADTNWTGLYLSVSAVANAVLRLAMWQLCDHEIVNIYHLSSAAKAALGAIKNPVRTTATQLPPLYPPLISVFHTRTGRFINRFIRSYEPLPEEHPRGATSQPIREYFDSFIYIVKNPLSILKSGFAETAAAPRWRPLIVLIHLSTQGRPQLRTLFTGFCEAALLLTLTFFFASQWGGNLYITAIALALILLFITVGRALAIIYVWLSARTWGLHAINCDEQNEILGCLRIVCSMEGVLVTVNGAHYFDGYRMDYEPEFAKWRRDYAKGVYDDVASGTATARPTQVSVQMKGSVV